MSLASYIFWFVIYISTLQSPPPIESMQKSKNPPTSVQYMILKNLMASLLEL